MTEAQTAPPASQAPVTASASGTPARLADIAKPAAGNVIVAEISDAERIGFAFAASASKVAILDIDLVVLFDDGAKIILPGLALRMISERPPQIWFGQEEVQAQQLLAGVGEVQLADQLPQLIMSSSLRDPQKEAASGSGIPVVQMPSMPPVSLTPRPLIRVSNDETGANGLQVASTGRFVSRRNTREEDTQGSASGGGVTSAVAPASAGTPELETGNGTPTLTSDGGGVTATRSVAENTLAVTTVTGTDPEAGPLQYAIAGGADAARFAINSETGALYFINAPNFETPLSQAGTNIYAVRVAVVDDVGGSDEQDIQVTVTNVNERPTGANLSNSTIAENAAAGTILGTVTGLDPEGPAGLVYSFAPGGSANGQFVIDPATGIIRLTAAAMLDAETRGSETVVVRVTDAGGLSFDRTFTLTVTNINEPPVISSNGGGPVAVIQQDENAFQAAQVFAADPELVGITYSIVGGADAGRLTIDPATGVLRFLSAPNFESPADFNGDNRYDVIVQASDGTFTDQQTLQINVVNANDAPTGATLSANTVLESAPAGTLIGTVVGTDPDAGDVLTYAFAPGGDAAGRFVINGATGAISLAPAGVLDFETNSYHAVTVRVTDAGGLSHDQVLVIQVLNSNDAPIITSNGGGALAGLSMAEGLSAVTTVQASDVDSPSITYTIIGGADALLFTINSTTGALSFAGTPDFDVPGDANGDNVYVVTVQASDGMGGLDTQTISITLTSANEAPTDLTLSPGTVAENVANGTVVGTVTATDPDAGATFTYAFAPGGDAGGRFAINAATGQITVADGSLLNFEASATHGVTVIVTDQGGLTYTETMTISLTNVNEDPVLTLNGGATVSTTAAENGTTVITTVTATDVDAGAALTYSMTGPDVGRFVLNATTGALRFNAAQNFELPGDSNADGIYTVTVQVSDGLGGIDTQVINVTLTNVNEAPTNITLPVQTVAENAANGTVISTATGVDPDAGATFTYSFAPGGDAGGRFAINPATGQLTVANGSLLDHETAASHAITIRVTDQGGLTYDEVYTITVTDVNDAPTNVTLTPSTVAENVADGKVVGTAAGVDPDAGATFTYAFAPGGDAGGRFAINAATGQITVANGSLVDFEAATSHGVIVRVTDQGGLSLDRALTITVTNVNEAPTDLSLSASTVVETAANGTVIGSATPTDPDAGGSFTYAFDPGGDAGGRFAINAATGQITVANGSLLNHTTDPSHTVTVRVTDQGGLSYAEVMTIAVSPGNFAPTGITITPVGSVEQNHIVNGSFEQSALATAEGWYATPTGAQLTGWSIGGGGVDICDDDYADVGSTHGEFLLDTANFSNGSISQAMSGLVTGQNYEISLDASIIAGFPGNLGIRWNGVLVGNLNAATTTWQNFSYNVTAAAGSNLLELVEVGASDIYGTLIDNVQVTGLAASPAVVEGAAAGTVVAQLAGVDANAGDTFTYALTAGRTDLYEIVGDEIRVRAGIVIDYEEATTHSLTVRVTDAGGLSTTQNLSVSVVDQFDQVLGTTGADVLSGSGGDDFVSGRAGDDLISTGGGEDWIQAGAGNDTIEAGAQADTIDGGAGIDTLTYAGSTQSVTVSLAGGTGSGGDAQGDVFSSIETLIGGNGNDILNGDNASQALSGGIGNDAVYGGAGNDILYGNGNNDTLDGDSSIEMAHSLASLTAGGWTGSGNGTGGATYGFVDANAAGGATRGELGGTFSRQGTLNYYADTDLGGTLNQSSALSFSTRLTIEAAAFPNMDIRLGWFNAAGDRFIGLNLAEPQGDGYRTTIGVLGGTNGFSSTLQMYQGVDYTVSFSYDPGSALATLTIAGASGGGTVSFAASMLGGVVFDRFGFLQTAMTLPSATSTIDLRVDDLSYTNASGNDTLNGDDGNDRLFSQNGTDVLNGGTGNDTLQGGRDFSYYDGGDDDDMIILSSGGGEAYGGNGDDVIYSGAAGTLMRGDAGSDTLHYGNSTAAVNVSLIAGTASGGYATGDNIAGFERIIGSSFNDTLIGDASEQTLEGGDGNDSLDGWNGNDVLHGEGGNDIILGGIGDDTVEGGAGNDVMYGGVIGTDTGTDTLSYASASGGVTVSLAVATAQSTGGAGTDVISGFENLDGSQFNDTLSGTSGNNIIDGLGGNDSIDGGLGNDTLKGGDGNDTLISTGGTDVMSGGTGDDTFWIDASALTLLATQITGGSGADTVNVSTGAALSLADLVNSMTGVETINLSGAGVAANLSNFTASDATSLLGASGPGNTLVLDLDANDTFAADAGQYTSFNAGTNTTTFFADSGLTTELARVQVV